MKDGKLELLAPAGDLERLKIAVEYGADAVYLGGEAFGLRAGTRNFSVKEMAEGVAYAHIKGRKVYLALNIFAHNDDIDRLPAFLNELKHVPIDAFIVSDPGILEIVKAVRSHSAIHLSTQANTTNHRSAAFWAAQGIDRIVLARELSLDEIRTIRAMTPPTLELEAFVQGAMCISYSGRCLLSSYMADRDANRGACAHPCRWSYRLVEEKRPEEHYPVFEDDRGTYVFSSRDLCMLPHLRELAGAGVTSFKLEGRMKSVFYVATIVGAYRAAIDAYESDPEHYFFDERLMEEIGKVSHRGFTTGFYFGKTTGRDQNYSSSSYSRTYVFLGLVRHYDPDTQLAVVEQRNKIRIQDEIEVFGPDTPCFCQKIDILLDQDGVPIAEAPHARQIVKIKMNRPVNENFIIRKRAENAKDIEPEQF